MRPFARTVGFICVLAGHGRHVTNHFSLNTFSWLLPRSPAPYELLRSKQNLTFIFVNVHHFLFGRESVFYPDRLTSATWRTPETPSGASCRCSTAELCRIRSTGPSTPERTMPACLASATTSWESCAMTTSPAQSTTTTKPKSASSSPATKSANARRTFKYCNCCSSWSSV